MGGRSTNPGNQPALPGVLQFVSTVYVPIMNQGDMQRKNLTDPIQNWAETQSEQLTDCSLHLQL